MSHTQNPTGPKTILILESTGIYSFMKLRNVK